jgi:hypothetical protein
MNESETNLILKRPRREIVTFMIVQLDHYISELLNKHWERAAMNSVDPTNSAKLTASILQLWTKISGEYKANMPNYKEMDQKFKTIIATLKNTKIDSVISFYNDIDAFLLKTGVKAFVNNKEYNPMIPEDEDEAKGL